MTDITRQSNIPSWFIASIAHLPIDHQITVVRQHIFALPPHRYGAFMMDPAVGEWIRVNADAIHKKYPAWWEKEK